jgi:hypothetical protein
MALLHRGLGIAYQLPLLEESRDHCYRLAYYRCVASATHLISQ